MVKNNQKRNNNGQPMRRNGPKRNGNGNGGMGNGGRRPNRSRQMGQVARVNVQSGLMNAQANVRPVVQNCQILRGSDFLSTVRVLPSPTTGERVLNEVFISPSFFPGTRITQMSQLWERYRFTSFRLRYVPAVPTTLACQLVIYFDTDPADDPLGAADPDTLIRQAVAHTGAQQWNFNLPKVVPLPMRNDDQMYYTGETKQNVRFTLQAKAFVLQVTDPLNFNGEPITDDVIAGSLYIDWVCKFQLPQINPAGYAIRDEATTQVVVNSGVAVPTSPADSVTLTGLKPYKAYTLTAAIPTFNPDVTTSRIYLQPKMSVREVWSIGTNRASTSSGTSPVDETTAFATSNARGEIPCWLYANSAVTPTANISFATRPA